MSAVKPASTTKKFQGKDRTVPHKSERAQRWYPAEDTKAPRKVRKTVHPTTYRPSLEPGSILIILAGRFRGKRVVLLKHLQQGALLVTGPFKINGVPLRRVNSRYVIATSSKVDVKELDEKVLEKVAAPDYFTKDKASEKKKSEEAFFKQGEKPEKKTIPSSRASDQKAIDKALLSTIKKEQFLGSYLASNFSLRKGDKPHEMKF